MITAIFTMQQCGTWHLCGLHHQVVVISHEAPRENRPTVEIADFAKGFDVLDSLMVVVENELAAGDAAIHVVGASPDKQTRVSRHEMAPMRGRDDLILPGSHLFATMVQW